MRPGAPIAVARVAADVGELHKFLCEFGDSVLDAMGGPRRQDAVAIVVCRLARHSGERLRMHAGVLHARLGEFCGFLGEEPAQ